jgi:hypothetical protein
MNQYFNNLQDFRFNIDPNGNIKRNYKNTERYKKYILDINNYINANLYEDKILLNIYIINNEFYISDLYLQSIVNYKFHQIPICTWLYKYLFDNIIQQDDIRSFTKEYLKLEYKYIQSNNEIIKVINLKNFIHIDESNILYKLSISNDLNSEIINICGLRNKIQQKYYNFIFKNIHFNFINYISDIEQLKQIYDIQINELNNKIKTMEMLLLEKF